MKNDEKIKSWARLVSIYKNQPDIEITTDSFTVGRKEYNNLSINNHKISSTHCIISREKEADGTYGYFIDDVSSNGTFHNGNKMGKQNRNFLIDGDTIEILTKSQVSEDGNLGRDDRCDRISVCADRNHKK